MLTFLKQIWNAKDLRRKIFFSLFIIIIFRMATQIPVPGINTEIVRSIKDNINNSGLSFLAVLTGGSMQNFSIVLMGLSPYINASIIMQLLTIVVPKLEAISKEGDSGRKKINMYTRWLTFPLAFLQSYGMILLLNNLAQQGLMDVTNPYQVLPVMLFVTAGTVFLMWLGELITENGIGNGISLLIFAGIVSNIPLVVGRMASLEDSDKVFSFLLFLVITVVLLIVIILFTEGHRPIPITYAGRSRGSQGGIPIRVNQAGMIPIIFAISMISFPSVIAQFMKNAESEWLVNSAGFIDTYLNASNAGYIYMLIYFLLIVGFSFFYVSIVFKPHEVAETIQKRGGFVPGMRPGKQTATYLEKVSNHLNLFGGVFLGIVAIIPLLFTKYTDLSSNELIISGSGLIIVVGVVLELIRQINAQLIMHDYEKLV